MPHTSAALVIPETRVVVQCVHTCGVAKHARACTDISVAIPPGSVQPLVPLPDSAAPSRGLSDSSPTRIRPRRAPFRVVVSRGGLHDRLRRFTPPYLYAEASGGFVLVSAQSDSPACQRFGKQANRQLAKETVLEYSSEFWLNKYFEKELFYAFKCI